MQGTDRDTPRQTDPCAGLNTYRPDQLQIVSTREDGLCMRLSTLLDASILAGLTGGDLRFLWSEPYSPAIDRQTYQDVRRIFTTEFIDRHLLAADALPEGRTRLARQPHTRADFDSLLRGGCLDVDQPLDLRQILPFAPPARDSHARAFETLGFTAPVRAAMAQARAVPLEKGSVALHIRGGDIVHGSHSHHIGYTHKAPSIFEIETVLGEYLATGPVWLIGKEDDLSAELARRYPLVSCLAGPGPHQALGDVERVFFDVVLLSRMERVLGGNSGVTQLACRIGQRPFTNLSRRDFGYRPEDYLDDPLGAEAYAGISANLKAHSYWKLIFATAPDAWGPTHLRLMELVRKWRPESRFHALIHGCMVFRLGDRQAAETLCAGVLADPLADQMVCFCLSEPELLPLAELACLAPADAATEPACHFLHRMALSMAEASPQAISRGLETIATARQTSIPALQAEVADMLSHSLCKAAKGAVAGSISAVRR